MCVWWGLPPTWYLVNCNTTEKVRIAECMLPELESRETIYFSFPSPKCATWGIILEWFQNTWFFAHTTSWKKLELHFWLGLANGAGNVKLCWAPSQRLLVYKGVRMGSAGVGCECAFSWADSWECPCGFVFGRQRRWDLRQPDVPIQRYLCLSAAKRKVWVTQKRRIKCFNKFFFSFLFLEFSTRKRKVTLFPGATSTHCFLFRDEDTTKTNDVSSSCSFAIEDTQLPSSR